MLEKLKQQVYEQNLALVSSGLVLGTWGNASGIDRESNLVVIKPSGVEYSEMTAEDMVVVDLFTGEVVEGNLRPSSDTATHLEIYKAFCDVGGVVHTHSDWATVLSQAGMSIAPAGTTHADYFYGEVPCTRKLTPEEINGEYEKNTGKVIVETFKGKNPLETPAVLVHEHGPFTFGRDVKNAVFNAVVLERVAKMYYHSYLIRGGEVRVQDAILKKHYLRKHGKNAYYGQGELRK